MFKNLFKKKSGSRGGSVILLSPSKGEVIRLQEVPDKVFAHKMLGEGFAVDPQEGLIYSPVDGVIKLLFPTLHAVSIETDEGLKVLIHIGIDTVDLNGQGFTTNIKLGDRVKKGDLLMKFDIEIIKENGKSPITPVIITNTENVKNFNFDYGFKNPGDIVLSVELK